MDRGRSPSLPREARKSCAARRQAAIAFLRLSSTLSRKPPVERPFLLRADKDGQILGHEAGFDRLDTAPLQG
jgi:hypothetical protein